MPVYVHIYIDIYMYVSIYTIIKTMLANIQFSIFSIKISLFLYELIVLGFLL